ncbi:MAG: serine/threonine protein kinase, partial [Proteobacteria bacterium]|nr:serine/threonine protein kinase [Pseudomonadota bacterium]
ILGRYQLEKPLGRGAMGTVYLGKDAKLNRLVAIKTLPLSQEFDSEQLPEATVRFFQEASAAGRLKHSNIVSIYDAGEEQNLAYISMEFFKGGTLVPYTQTDNLLPIATVINIIILMAEALDYAHSHGVIHRDIKPANIMYNPATNKVKITDFGIARITDANRTRTGIVLGTPSYMSPEQLAAKKIDGRSDLFSLGVMFYQLLSGVLPFESDSLTTLMFKIANEPHKDISETGSKIPNCIKQVVDIVLSKERKYRYQSGTQFAIALRDCNKFEEGIK